MHIVYSQLRPTGQAPKAKRMSRREAMARRWVELQEQRDYRKAIKENWTDIQEMQKVEPGWIPKFMTDLGHLEAI